MSRLVGGRGRPKNDRVPYLGEMAAPMLSQFRQCIVIGTKAPVAFFAYPNKPSMFLSPECKVHTPWLPENDLSDVLAALAEEVGAPKSPTITDGPAAAPPGPGKISVESIGTLLASLMPEGAIVSDEGNTSGLWPYMATQNAAPHDWLMLTGGAIGQGIPVATGAAVACPGRPVINLQSDGSAMYTIQGLWTQARENLHVITLLLNNKSYAILNMELDRVGATAQSERSRSLLSLDRPAMDFTAMGKSLGVDSVRASDNETLVSAFKRALAEPGPHLIEVML
jgi:acetolactate synthase-1/2/3 large subunit